ncbi:MAG: hypothetical protein ACXAC7_10270 [Candidatus Hodarchaeales archaeon]|jgi:hypothetical protein
MQSFELKTTLKFWGAQIGFSIILFFSYTISLIFLTNGNDLLSTLILILLLLLVTGKSYYNLNCGYNFYEHDSKTFFQSYKFRSLVPFVLISICLFFLLLIDQILRVFGSDILLLLNISGILLILLVPSVIANGLDNWPSALLAGALSASLFACTTECHHTVGEVIILFILGSMFFVAPLYPLFFILLGKILHSYFSQSFNNTKILIIKGLGTIGLLFGLFLLNFLVISYIFLFI